MTIDDGHTPLHADETMLDRAAEAVAGSDCIVSVGGGTITDIVKIAALRASVAVHVVVQTAASVDGFTDNVSVVLQNGVKRTVASRWPDAVLTGCRTIAEAPHTLNAAGLGELLLSMYSAPGDWLLAERFGMDDTFSPVLIDLLALCGEGVADWAAEVGARSVAGVQRLAAALAMRGIVTGVGGGSAALSGMEHLVSHMLDMHHAERGEPIGLHGAQVGVASVIAAAWEEFCSRMEQAPDPAALFGPIEAWEGGCRRRSQHSIAAGGWGRSAGSTTVKNWPGGTTTAPPSRHSSTTGRPTVTAATRSCSMRRRSPPACAVRVRRCGPASSPPYRTRRCCAGRRH